MVGIQADGRMGNQMFQIAFILALKRRLNTSYFVRQSEVNHHAFCLDHYFQLPDFSRLKHLLPSKLLKFCTSEEDYRQSNKRPEKILKQLTNNKFYRGFFQSHLYFIDQWPLIEENFKIKKFFIDRFQHKYTDWTNKSFIAVHIRLKDYKKLTNAFLGIDYFQKVLTNINDIQQDIVILSDEPELAKKYFNPDRYFFPLGEKMDDFIFLSKANHLIISNSSFAYWAAMLNKNNPEVWAPKYWLGHKNKIEKPIGIHYEKWHWINYNS